MIKRNNLSATIPLQSNENNLVDDGLKNWLEGNIGQLHKQELFMLEEARKHFASSETNDLTQKIFNNLHEKKKQRLLGIAYTPPEIRNELTEVVLKKLSQSKNISECKIMDPCCGSGSFSTTLLDKLIKIGVNPKQALEKNIFLQDIDRLSVALSMVNIFEHLRRIGIDATKIKLNAKVSDFLTSNNKFDGFITNPPYVKLQNLPVSVREFLKNKYSNFFTGALGLSAIFLKKMFDDLNDDGVVGVITQNNFFTSNAGALLRKKIERNILKIDTFGSEHIFEGVTTYTCLMYLTNKEQTSFGYRKISNQNGFNQNASMIKNGSLDSSKWRLGTKDELEDLNKLENIGVPLKDACRIWVGIATQFDKGFTVFIEGKNWVGTDPDGQKIIIEKEIVKNLIRVADLSTFESIKNNNRGVIYPYKIVEGKPIVMQECDLLANFPKAYEFLSSWKTELMARQKGRVADSDWYKWGRIQSMIPVKNKLLTKTFNRGPCFYFDESDSLFSNGYAITPNSEKYDLRFIQAVLNSKVFGYYAKLTSFEIGGQYQCYQKNFIERFCLPDIDKKQQAKFCYGEKVDEFLVEYYSLSSSPSSD